MLKAKPWYTHTAGWLCALLAAAQVVAAVRIATFYGRNGYLPSPFLFEKYDTFMDFFHPMYWADIDGRYTDWASVYPPLTFLFLKLVRWFVVDAPETISAFWLRYEAGAAAYILVGSGLFASLFMMSRPNWARISVGHRIWIYLIAVLSAPMLFALERGNLILLTLWILPFLFVRAPVQRIIAATFLINIKPYFVLLLLAYVFKRRWNELLVAIIMTGCLYLVTCAYLDSDPFDLPRNLLGFSQNATLFSAREVMAMPSSVSAFSYVISSQFFHVEKHIFSFEWSTVVVLIEISKWTATTALIVALWCCGERLSIKITMAALLIVITNLGVMVGGYTMIFYLALLPVVLRLKLRWSMGFCIALIAALPTDFIPLREDIELSPQFSYLGGHDVWVAWSLGLGSVIRPVANFVLLVLMAAEVWMRYVASSRVAVQVRNKLCLAEAEGA